MFKLTSKISKIKNGNKKKLVFNILFLLSLILFGISASQNAQAATSYFSPSSGNFTIGNVFTVTVLVNTEGVAINNAEAVINFPKDLLELISVTKSGSIFSLWVEEPTFSNSAGTLSLNGGLPTPGFTGTAGKMINAVFRVKKGGSASLVFSSAAVRANDGYGTNVFRTGAQAQFNLISEGKPLLPEEGLPPARTVDGASLAPQISSPTHQDPDKWYAKKDAKFTWDLPPGVTGVRLLVGEIPRATPTVVYAPAISEKEITNVADGVWYFHAQFRNASGWGEITHFRFQIDTQPPEPFIIKFIDGNETENPKPTVVFDTTDSLSGVNYYRIKIGEGDFFSAVPEVVKSNPYTLPSQHPGKRNILVQAFDKAENYSIAIEEFTIKPLQAPVFTEYPKTLEGGEILTVTGLSQYPNSQIGIWLQKEKDNPKSFTVESDSDGKFTFTADEKLRDGIYQLWAEAVDGRGARSLPSEKIIVAVAKSAIFRVGTQAVNFLAVIVPLVLLIITLLFILWYGWYKFLHMRKRLRKEVSEVESALHKAFDSLKEDIRKQVKILEKTRTKRQLTEEEEKVIAQLKQNLNNAEEFVRKEIEDIEREIK